MRAKFNKELQRWGIWDIWAGWLCVNEKPIVFTQKQEAERWIKNAKQS